MNNRKKWLVNPKFQIQFILWFFIPTLIALICFWIGIEVFFTRMIEFGQSSSIGADHGYYAFLKVQRFELLQIAIYSILSISILFSLVAYFYSHRIAGPLFKMTKYFNEAQSIEEVKNSPIHFRKKDLFPELAQAFRNFSDRL